MLSFNVILSVCKGLLELFVSESLILVNLLRLLLLSVIRFWLRTMHS